MLIGVGGSGKQSLSRLAAFICGFEVRQLSVTSKFKVGGNLFCGGMRIGYLQLETAKAVDLVVLVEIGIRYVQPLTTCLEILSPVGNAKPRLDTFQHAIFFFVQVDDLKEALQEMFKTSGVKGNPLLFLMTDGQIVNERFLIYINDILANGWISDLFPKASFLV